MKFIWRHFLRSSPCPISSSTGFNVKTVPQFTHQRHKPPRGLSRPRELIVAVGPMRSNVNLSRIVRAAGCCGVTQIVACGNPKIDRKIARDAIDHVQLQTHRSLLPPLGTLKSQGYQMVGLEQVSGSCSLFDFRFVRRTVLVIGHERHGLSDELLQLMDHVVEIPVYGLPFSHNAATAAAMSLYEFCRQFPDG